MHKPLPAARAALGFEATYSAAQAERMRAGFMPRDMDDRWLVLHEDGWFLFCRSWTGFVVFWLRLEDTSSGARVSESWVNRDPAEYKSDDLESDRDRLSGVIARNLLQPAP